MMIPPRHPPPYLPIYPEADRSRIQAAYEQADREWQKDASRTMVLNAVPVLCALIGLAAAALFGPSIVLDAIVVLAQVR